MKSLNALQEELKFRIALRNAYDGHDKDIWETLHTNVAVLQEELNARLNQVGSNGGNGKEKAKSNGGNGKTPGNGKPTPNTIQSPPVTDDIGEDTALYSRE